MIHQTWLTARLVTDISHDSSWFGNLQVTLQTLDPNAIEPELSDTNEQ